MATRETIDLPQRIAAVESRIGAQKRALHAAIDAARVVARDTFTVRRSTLAAFLAAAAVGVIGGLRARTMWRGRATRRRAASRI